jgi:hypothetical protein
MKSFRINTLFFLCYHLNDVSAFSPISPTTLVSMKPSSTRNGQVPSSMSGRRTSSINPLFARNPKTEKIERTWECKEENGDLYEAGGKMTVKVFLPEEGDVKGCVYFMHGFSQYTEAYSDSLAKISNSANVAIISPETGITSLIVLCELLSNPLALLTDRIRAQFVLQRALSEDMKQCIDMVKEGGSVFEKLGIPKRVPKGVAGHSMGGGLSFPVAAEKDIDYVFTMAPFGGVPQFDPITAGVDVRAAKNSMLLAGLWDLIAKADGVSEISAMSNEKCSGSSTYVAIKRGLHTGFEDELVITKLPLDTILGKILALFVNIPGLLESVIFAFLGFLRTNTGQLEGSEELMEFFFQKMVSGQKVTAKDADKFLQSNLKTEWYEKFNITTV